MAAGQSRGSGDATVVPRGFKSVAFKVDLIKQYPEYVWEIRDSAGRTVFPPRKENANGLEFTALASVRTLRSGEYTLMLSGLQDGQPVPLGDHAVLLEIR